MDNQPEFDELLMTVVDAALKLPLPEREKYLCSACANNELLYREAKERVDWEERMGGFLQQPLLVRKEFSESVQTTNSNGKFQRKLLMVGMTIALLVAGLFWVTREPEAVRLAILASDDDTSGTRYDVKERLSGVRRRFEILLPEDQEVSTLESAKSVLGATHVLRLKSGSLTTVDGRELFLAKDDAVAAVEKEFHISARPAVSGAAYDDYLKGLRLLHNRQADPTEALAAFNLAMEKDGRAVQLPVSAAQAELQKLHSGGGREWLDRAGASLSKAKTLQPSYVPALVLSGRYQLESGNFEEATVELLTAVKLDPTNSEGWQALAASYLGMHNVERALATYGAAIAAQPESYWPYLLRGTFFEREKRWAEAQRDFSTVCKLVPGWDQGKRNLAGVVSAK